MSSEFNRLYIFGDSLSDTGSVFNFTGGAFPPSPPYIPGRFTGGQGAGVWTDYFTEELNITVDPFITSFDPVTGVADFNFSDSSDGINFATGGAFSGNGSVGGIPFGLQEQIDIFEFFVESQNSTMSGDDDDGDEFLEDSLSIMWIGPNDYFNFIQDDPTTPDVIETNFPETEQGIEQAVSTVVEDNIAGAIQDIIDLGAEDIVVLNLPDLSGTPLAQTLDSDSRDTLRDITGVHNDLLLDTLDNLEESNDDVNIVHIDINSLYGNIIENPSEFGFTNITDNFSGIDIITQIPQTPTIGNPNEYLFFDSIHPTTAAHEIIADFIMDRLESADLLD